MRLVAVNQLGAVILFTLVLLVLKGQQQADVTSDQHSQSDWSQLWLSASLGWGRCSFTSVHVLRLGSKQVGAAGTAVGPNASWHLTGNWIHLKLKGHCVVLFIYSCFVLFSETQYIYNMNEVMMQTLMTRELFSVPQNNERWQGPPHVNKVQLSHENKESLFIQFVLVWNSPRKKQRTAPLTALFFCHITSHVSVLIFIHILQ